MHMCVCVYVCMCVCVCVCVCVCSELNIKYSKKQANKTKYVYI